MPAAGEMLALTAVASAVREVDGRTLTGQASTALGSVMRWQADSAVWLSAARA